MKDWSWFINHLAEQWEPHLRRVADGVVEGNVLGDNFDWIASNTNVESMGKAMPEIWEGMGDVFKRELLQQIFKESGPHVSWMANRTIYQVEDSASWIFRCVLTKIVGRENNRSGLIVGGDNTRALFDLGKLIKKDAIRMFGDFIKDQRTRGVGESARAAIDSVHGLA